MQEARRAHLIECNIKEIPFLRVLIGYIKEYSQWFPGKKNNIADSLSRDFDLDDAELSKYLHLHYPSQLPPHFQVVRIG